MLALGVSAPAGHANGPRSLAVWGTKGSGPGQFQGPMGIDVGAEGVYVTDRGNSRVQVFNADGGFIREIGKYGDANGEFLSIARIHVGTLGDLYISEDNGRIQKFFEDGRVRRYGGSGAGNGLFDGACGITVDYASGLVYVVDTKNCRVQKLDQFGAFRGAWGTKGSGEGQFNGPTGIAGTYGVFYVVDSGNSRIVEMSDDGAVRRVFGRPGDGAGELNEPMGVALDRDDNVYVADTGNDRVVVFDRSGDFITQWKVTGGSAAEGRFVADIAVDSDGNVYVIDTVQNYVQKFGPISTSTDGTPPTTKVKVAARRRLLAPKAGDAELLGHRQRRRLGRRLHPVQDRRRCLDAGHESEGAHAGGPQRGRRGRGEVPLRRSRGQHRALRERESLYRHHGSGGGRLRGERRPR